MEDILQKKISILTQEASTLSKKKQELLANVSNIDIRIHQIVGAIKELDSILQELKGNANENV